MKIVIAATPAAASSQAAHMIAQSIRANPRIVLGLATGRTMDALYAELVASHKNALLDFADVTSFNLDEYIGLPPSHPHSYRHYMHTRLFRHVNIQTSNTHIPNGMAADVLSECLQYEEKITAAGGIELQLLGLGISGHIGFNEPGTGFDSTTHRAQLHQSTIAQNAVLFDSADQVPHQAITMGLETIMRAQRCIVLVTGKEKAKVLADTVGGPVGTQLPASILQRHPECTIVADRDAAIQLSV